MTDELKQKVARYQELSKPTGTVRRWEEQDELDAMAHSLVPALIEALEQAEREAAHFKEAYGRKLYDERDASTLRAELGQARTERDEAELKARRFESRNRDIDREIRQIEAEKGKGCEWGHHMFTSDLHGGFTCTECGSKDPEGDTCPSLLWRQQRDEARELLRQAEGGLRRLGLPRFVELLDAISAALARTGATGKDSAQAAAVAEKGGEK